MNSVRHTFDIAAPVATVYHALVTADGLSGWWTMADMSEHASVGTRIGFTFGGRFNPQMEIEELEENRLVAWLGVGGHDAWGPTRIRFELATKAEETCVRFRHDMGSDLDAEAIATANFNWGYYLNSLRQLCEIGCGNPFTPGDPTARPGADKAKPSAPARR